MSRPLLITFSGIDGSGKTTQSRRLVDRLRGDGHKVTYVWNRFDPIALKPAMIIGKRALMPGKDIRKDYAEFDSAREKVFSNSIIAATFRRLYLVEYVMHTALNVSARLALGQSVVCDRYVYDTVVGLAADLSAPLAWTRQGLQWCLRYLPTPTIAFLCDVDEDAAFHRKTDTPALEHLQKRRGMFLTLAAEVPLLVLDGGLLPATVQAQIDARVDELLALQRTQRH